MTELNEIDSVLRGSFARMAEPGDPAGVADAIRSRLAAGDAGTPAQSSGFGGGGLGPWLLGGAIVVVAALGGGAIGASGLVGTPPAEQIELTVLAVDATTDAYDCPGGSPVSTFTANERALVVARTEDSAWLAVRDSYDYSRTVWLPASVVSVDAGQGDVGVVPVQNCVVPQVVVNTPAPVAVPVAPAAPAADARPQITGISQTEKSINQVNYPPDRSVFSVSATDDKAVSSVTATWPSSGDVPAGSANLAKSGGVWTFTFGPYSNGSMPDAVVTITFTALDSKGQASITRTATVTVSYILI